MDDATTELHERFAAPNEELRPEILSELQSILRLHKTSPEELSYKWESYCMKMGAEETKLDLKTTRDFKKDLQEMLEQKSRGKVHKGSEQKRTVGATPRAGAGGGDVFGMLDNLIPNTPQAGGRISANNSTIKRKSNFETPASKANKSHPMSSPGATQTPDTIATTNFADRANAGDIISSLNDHIPESTPSDAPPAEPRIKLKANTDMLKFNYKTMGMKLNEASEILDDRIEEFQALVQEHHQLEDNAFGNPSRESQSEIIAVGRIASDSPDGKLNPASIVLETSRRMTGVRVSLKLDKLTNYDFFRGKIVALRGTNASGDFFTVNEVLSMPLLGGSASLPTEIDAFNARVRAGQDEFDDLRPLTVMMASGPYTTEESLDFGALHALLDAAEKQQIDTLILSGPFLDTEHPLIRSGDFELPANFPVEPDKATLNDVFKYHITKPLITLTQSLPSINIVLVPSVRDTVSKHAAWPQDRFPKKDLGLPRQVSVVTNPITISLNEMVFGISTQDVIEQLRASQVVGGRTITEDFYARAARQIIEQRHYFPVFPPSERLPNGDGFDAIGASLDISYLKLGEIYGGRPDILVLPSTLGSFIKVTDGVISINPGTLSKKKAWGTYARLTILPLSPTDEERESGEMLIHKLWERARVDIVRI